MVWTGSAQYKLAPALLTLLGQLTAAYPGREWQSSLQTGTIGDAKHRAEGWGKSDHVPFLSPSGLVLPVGAEGGVVRALDVAVNVSGVQGIATVTDGPPGEVLFSMVNAMYAARDSRVSPDGYVIFQRRITDPDNPGRWKPYSGGDPHVYHVHISVSRNPAGFNSTALWPLPSAAESPADESATPVEVGMFEILQDADTGALRAAGLGFWKALDGATKEETAANLANARSSPLCGNGKQVRRISHAGMVWWRDFYLTGGS